VVQLLGRRLITIPGYLLAWGLWWATLPLWLLFAVTADLYRRSPWVALRSAGVITVYLTCEVLGLAASAGLWIRNQLFPFGEDRWEDLHFRLEAWWGTTIFMAVVRLFGLRLETESDSDLGEGPYLLLFRHTSSADTLLASALVSRPFGMRLRYVLKRELLWDPCLDVVGHRLPNVFVDRSSDDASREVEKVKGLARDLGPQDGALIFPEGTRFSPAKRARVLERIEASGDPEALAYARKLACVLPPRLGGTLGLLQTAPEADVIVCSHVGFEGAGSIGRLWRGDLVDRTIRVQFQRTPRRDIPSNSADQVAWLRSEWRRVASWVASHQTSPAGVVTP
jgi:1-acyl-sn-glycerol-3-phosphate acyltransferase